MEIEAFLYEWKDIESELTRIAYRGYLRRFQVFCTDHGLDQDDVRSWHIREFAQLIKQSKNYRTGTEGVSDSTVQSYLAAVSAYYQWRQERNPELRNPVSEFKFHRTEKPRKVQPIPTETATAMCKESGDKAGVAIVELIRRGGPRLAEVVAMNKDTLKPVVKQGSIVCAKANILGKGKKRRNILESLSAMAAVEKYLDDRGPDENPALILSIRKRRISRRTIQRKIKAMAVKVGMANASPHQLRHTFSSDLAEKNVPEKQIARLLGHNENDLQTTYRYITISDSTLKKESEEASRKISGRRSLFLAGKQPKDTTSPPSHGTSVDRTDAA